MSTDCCLAKAYFSRNKTMAKTLQILPRVIIYRKQLKISQTYEQVITIINHGLYSRNLIYYTDSESDTTITMLTPDMINRFLAPDQQIQLQINIAPKKRQNINHIRNIYIRSDHPHIIFEIPIIVIGKEEQPYLPTQIIFPPSSPKTKTHYEFTIFNPTLTPLKMSYKNVNKNLNIDSNAEEVPPKDYMKLLFTLSVKDANSRKDSLRIKIQNVGFVVINYEHVPLHVSLHINMGQLNFERTKYERTKFKEFTVCNDSDREANYQLEFLTGTPDFEKKLYTDNESADEVEFIHSEKSSDGESESKDVEKNFGYKYLSTDMKSGILPANTSKVITITFRPIMCSECNFDDNVDSPFDINAKLLIKVVDELNTEVKELLITGIIVGPEVEFAKSFINFRKIYLGEEHCEILRVWNVDGVVDTAVHFEDYVNKSTANITVTPRDSLHLKPCRDGTFHLSFYALTAGKFIVKLSFKVTNGRHYNTIITGIANPVRVRTFPEFVEFGTIPFAVPQKRYVLLMNPLSVEITVQCKIREDGQDTPLVLNVRDVEENIPITIKDPVMLLEQSSEPYTIGDDYSIEPSQYSFHSVSSLESVSTVFEDEVLAVLPDFANTLVVNIKKGRYIEKNEVEKKIIDDAVKSLTSTKYFSELCAHKNFAYSDWNLIPSDPKEIYIDSELIHLKPNSGKSITILIVPNVVGYHNRSLDIRVCPNTMSCPEEGITMMPSENLTAKLWLEYTCRLPDIQWDDTVDLRDQTIYSGQDYFFDIYFENFSNVGGFIYFDVVPDGEEGVIYFIDDMWKFYINAGGDINAYCSVLFRKSGKITLSGVIKFLGNVIGKPYHVIANVLPTRLFITPKVIIHRQDVLEKTRIYVYIENATPTITPFTISLKNYAYQDIEPKGAILSPAGQGIYVTIHSKFYDPHLHKNVMYVNSKYGTSYKIPLSFNIIGMPIFFEPNIREGMDVGCILTNTEDNFYANIPNFTKNVKVINRGHRSYTIEIHKLKTGKLKCEAPRSKANIQITPQFICISSGKTSDISISFNACEETTVYHEFLVQVADQHDKSLVMTILLKLTATFIPPRLNWNHKQVTFNYYQTHIFKEHLQMEMVELNNIACVPIDKVNLKILGPFKIKEHFEDHYKKELSLSFAGLESKELSVMLNKDLVQNKFCTHLDGRIICIANETPQKTLLLRVNIFKPAVIIPETDLVLFSKRFERNALLDIVNVGCVEAHYKWKKLDEFIEFVGEQDDAYEITHQLLSDIFRMLDLESDEESEVDSINERNMSLRYEKYRCKLKKLHDPIDIKYIINHIIDNLDLEHKRYIIKLNEHLECGDQLLSIDDSEVHSSASYINKTVDTVIDLLHLEDSYQVSQASLEECQKERHIYFYEKAGVLAPNEKLNCLVHLPAIRKGYAQKATYQLDVVGGLTQKLEITVVNFEKTVELTKYSIYLGVKPWYELFKVNVRAQNVTQYRLSLCFEPIVQPRKCFHVCSGYVKVRNDKFLYLQPKARELVKTEGILGFSEEFERTIKIVVNDSEQIDLRLRGQGVMPILSVSNKLPRIEQNEVEVLDEYRLLQRIYYFEMFKGITEEDEELPQIHEENEDQQLDQISIITATTNDSATSRTREQRFFRLVRTYVLVNNNEELPNATVLEQLLETEKFLKCLNENALICTFLNMVYRDYVKMIKCNDEKLPINLKHFTAQPLPFKLHGHILNMNQLKMGVMKKFQIDLQFFGPGKLIAAARTVIKIPGLSITFDVAESDDIEFIYYKAEKKSPDFYDKPYRNMFEREIDLKTDVKLTHAHSFDIGTTFKHERLLSKTNRESVKNYYNSLNKSVYMEHKHHFVLCKIFSNSKKNFTGTQLHVKILIKPEKKFYEDDQLIEDFIYIDLHMGPSLPILLRGLIVK